MVFLLFFHILLLKSTQYSIYTSKPLHIHLVTSILLIHMFLQKPFINYSQTTLIWVITHTQTKHKDLLGFVLNPNSITCNLTMNLTSKGGFHTLDPIRIYFRVRFLTTHNPQKCIIQIYTKFHTKIQRSILESIPLCSSLLFFLSSSSSSSLFSSSLLFSMGLFSPKMRPNLVLN